MNLYEMLRKDHERVRELFLRLEATGESDISGREQIYAALLHELDVHTRAEEKFFYSLLKGEADTRELILESLDDHRDVMRRLESLDAMDKGSAEWIAGMHACREAVERHVAEEESELFPRARKVLDEDTAAGVAEDIEAFKEEHAELEAR